MFFCKTCEIFKNTYFEEHLRTTASMIIAKAYPFFTAGSFKIQISVSKAEWAEVLWGLQEVQGGAFTRDRGLSKFLRIFAAIIC